MTTASELHSQLVDLASDPAVAGLSLTGRYESLTGPTVTPPAGTIRPEKSSVPRLRKKPRAFTLAMSVCVSAILLWSPFLV